MIDLSEKEELGALGRVLTLFNLAAQNVVERWLIVGATARDLILYHAYRSRVARATDDLDIAVALSSWTTYGVLKDRLIDAGARPHSGITHRFLIGDWKVDIVPFGAIERDGVIVWPQTETEMSVAGFR